MYLTNDLYQNIKKNLKINLKRQETKQKNRQKTLLLYQGGYPNGNKHGKVAFYFSIKQENENPKIMILPTLGGNVNLLVHISYILVICALSCMYVIFL